MRSYGETADFLIRRSRGVQVVLLMLADVAVIAAACSLAYFARFEGTVANAFQGYLLPFTVVSVVLIVACLWTSGLYHQVLRYVGIDVISRLTAAIAVAMTLLVGLDALVSRARDTRAVPYGVILITGAFAFVGLMALRSVGRLWIVMNRMNPAVTSRVLVLGAGDAASLLLRDIESQKHLGLSVVGLLDDDAKKWHCMVRGIKVLGPIGDLPNVLAKEQVDEVLLAIPSLELERRREILNLCTLARKKTRIISGIAADTGVSDLRRVEIDDLLGREPVKIDTAQIAATICGKVVAVTGAAGSIGSELCRQIMKMQPKKLVLIEIDETRLYELYLELKQLDAAVPVMRLCDIRDARKLQRVFKEEHPAVVFHAAAYKHVPLMEQEPEEAVRANVLGTRNVLVACKEEHASRFVLISTDKAVEPRNVMGATKNIAEQVMIAAAKQSIGAVAVRFGNVLGSRGSVIPLFETQLRHGGPVRVTHPDMTRYFMTIPEAARLVLQAQALSTGGDIFVLDMGEPVRIIDLARRMIVLSGVPARIEFSGIRPGEKLHETLVGNGGDLQSTACPSVMKLDALPCIGDRFSSQIDSVIRAASEGRTDETIRLLCEISGARLSEVMTSAQTDAGSSSSLSDMDEHQVLLDVAAVGSPA